MMTVTDIASTIILLVHSVIALAAIISIGRVAASLTLVRCGLWVLLVFFVPIIGGILWFGIGKRRALASAAASDTQLSDTPPSDTPA